MKASKEVVDAAAIFVVHFALTDNSGYSAHNEDIKSSVDNPDLDLSKAVYIGSAISQAGSYSHYFRSYFTQWRLDGDDTNGFVVTLNSGAQDFTFPDLPVEVKASRK